MGTVVQSWTHTDNYYKSLLKNQSTSPNCLLTVILGISPNAIYLSY